MLAYTYIEHGKFELREKPEPEITDARDAIVRVTLGSICTSDLHIKHGSVPRAVPGITVGHEMVGVVEEVGAEVTSVSPGDRVTVNVETFCGECFFCHHGYVNNCTDPNGGWAFESLKGLHRMRVETSIETAKSYLEGITKSIQAHEQLFETLGVKTLEECNKVLGLKKRLLRTFVIIDEVAVWMIDDDFKAKLLNALEAISTKGWSTGYHLILATQWPDPRVLPKEVRDHFGNRISLKLPTAEMSEYALGIKGAEELTDLGHMLAVLAGEPKPINCWVPWLSDEDAERMVTAIRVAEDR